VVIWANSTKLPKEGFPDAHEAFTGEKPNVAHFQEFGTDVWIYQEVQKADKLFGHVNKFR
jgi:hypothetical protein